MKSKTKRVSIKVNGHILKGLAKKKAKEMFRVRPYNILSKFNRIVVNTVRIFRKI